MTPIQHAGRAASRAVFLVLALALLLTVEAQAPKVTIEGRILDQTRAPIAGARVTTSSEGDTRGISALSASNGEFSLILDPGDYTLRIAADGFADSTQAIKATAPPSAPLEIVLTVSALRETVTVSEAAGYQIIATSTATKTPTALIDVPQSITIVTKELIKDQMMQKWRMWFATFPG